MCGLQMISLANMSGYYAKIRDFFTEDSVYLSSSISIDEMEMVIINGTKAQYPMIVNNDNMAFDIKINK